jgi:hypothetical protein
VDVAARADQAFLSCPLAALRRSDDPNRPQSTTIGIERTSYALDGADLLECTDDDLVEAGVPADQRFSFRQLVAARPNWTAGAIATWLEDGGLVQVSVSNAALACRLHAAGYVADGLRISIRAPFESCWRAIIWGDVESTTLFTSPL